MRKQLQFKTVFLACTMMFLMNNLTNAQNFVQNFDDLTGSPMIGWDTINNSSPLGVHSFFQGNTTVFTPQSGAGYLGSNYNATSGTGTISAWLISPVTTLHNGDFITFWLRKTDSVATNYADRLQVRFSTSGASGNVGTSATSVGDFTYLVTDINPNYSNVGWPTGFPYVWTKFNLTVSGITGSSASGRIAFRYFVENGGTTGTNSDYIGLDSIAFHASGVGINEHTLPNTSISVYPNPVGNVMHIDASIVINKVKISNLLGQVIETINLKASSAKINTCNYTTGVYYVNLETNQGNITRKVNIVH